ncbi:MAG TPA: LEA type 2 family protein [Flavobacteriales bacterium]|nr:LEA type 2 family protein [Flavobacteriales bacterium]
MVCGRCDMGWKKSILVVLLLLMVAAISLQLIRWSQAKRDDPNATFILPRLRLAVITIKDLTPDTMNMDVGMLIDDPAPLGAHVDSFTYRFSIAGVEMVHSTHPDPIDLHGYDSTLITLPITVRQELLATTLKDLEARGVDSVDYTIDADFHTRLPFLKKKPVHLHVTRHLPLFIIPTVELTHTHVEKFGLKNTRLLLDVQVANPNNVAFAFRKTAYQLRVGGDRVMSSHMEDTLLIPSRDTVMFSMPVKLDLGETAGTLIDLLVAPGTDYAFSLDTRIVSDDRSVNEGRLVLERNGTLKDLKQ